MGDSFVYNSKIILIAFTGNRIEGQKMIMMNSV